MTICRLFDEPRAAGLVDVIPEKKVALPCHFPGNAAKSALAKRLSDVAAGDPAGPHRRAVRLPIIVVGLGKRGG
jgi:hypothetical protein